ncbi:MAG: cytochrome bc complex cytochrome b subunit [Nitrospirota bacterium]|jgi:ubiquinol-cytochrome c reductase cytochrome b subunit
MDWLEVRIGLSELVRGQLTEYRVPRGINVFYTLGFVALAAFAIQVLSGIVLLVYYVPYSEKAFESVQGIMTEVHYGWLFRQIHVVSSNLMVVVVFLHMASVFVMGSYKRPRELTWVVGVLMFLSTLAFCVTGYLLPWSQLSYWATTIVTDMPTAFPLVGEALTKLLRGGQRVSGITLNRFFAFHVALIPLAFIFLAGFHVFLVRRTGISTPPYGSSPEEEGRRTAYRHESHPGGHPFYPYFVAKETYMTMAYLAAVFFVIAFMPTLFLPEEANVPADPSRTPAHIKPEWYFLAPYQMLRLIPNKFLGITLQLMFVGVVLLWPFVDRREERNILRRPLLLGALVLAVAAWAVLTAWGRYS